jgi:hypothetical protein
MYNNDNASCNGQSRTLEETGGLTAINFNTTTNGAHDFHTCTPMRYRCKQLSTDDYPTTLVWGSTSASWNEIPFHGGVGAEENL